MADVKEILVHRDAGGSISGLAHSLGYSRPTVRKYVQAAERVGLVRGTRPIDEVGWECAARAALGHVAVEPRVGDASVAIAAYHDYLAERVGSARQSVLHQRLRDEQKLRVSWASYRNARQHWPERLRRVTVRLDDPPPGEEAQIDYFYIGRWEDPETQHRHRLSAFLMTLRLVPTSQAGAAPTCFSPVPTDQMRIRCRARHGQHGARDARVVAERLRLMCHATR